MPKTSISTIPDQNTNLSLDNILEFFIIETNINNIRPWTSRKVNKRGWKTKRSFQIMYIANNILHEPESNDPNLHNHLKSRALFLSRIDHVTTWILGSWSAMQERCQKDTLTYAKPRNGHNKITSYLKIRSIL
jgi:hypothetical protein